MQFDVLRGVGKKVWDRVPRHKVWMVVKGNKVYLPTVVLDTLSLALSQALSDFLFQDLELSLFSIIFRFSGIPYPWCHPHSLRCKPGAVIDTGPGHTLGDAIDI